MPFRKPRTRALTKKQKKDNKKISRFRVRVENAIAGIKRLRCVTDICRTKKRGVERPVDVAKLWTLELSSQSSLIKKTLEFITTFKIISQQLYYAKRKPANNFGYSIFN